ncbi:hypothetical protein KAW64_00825, partial [bacterium]|nr:hypothetical protein [bacterium]
RLHYWDELIGPGPPPVKTREGWLLVYHGIATHLAGACIYQAGVALLALDDPSNVLARSRDNILEPRETYEIAGQVPNVVFPSGMIVERYDEQGARLLRCGRYVGRPGHGDRRRPARRVQRLGPGDPTPSMRATTRPGRPDAIHTTGDTRAGPQTNSLRRLAHPLGQGVVSPVPPLQGQPGASRRPGA